MATKYPAMVSSLLAALRSRIDYTSVAVDVDEEGRAAVLRWMQHFNNSEPVLRSMLGRAYDGFDDDDYSKLTCWLNKTCPVPP